MSCVLFWATGPHMLGFAIHTPIELMLILSHHPFLVFALMRDCEICHSVAGDGNGRRQTGKTAGRNKVRRNPMSKRLNCHGQFKSLVAKLSSSLQSDTSAERLLLRKTRPSLLLLLLFIQEGYRCPNMASWQRDTWWRGRGTRLLVDP